MPMKFMTYELKNLC